mmetsp:Transcript_45491/g.134651  ORF Transcript_45491/g.134651 Transcript_45491/m.134651 type:complete len:241 (+) Transcript_45491:1173-1895(+)
MLTRKSMRPKLTMKKSKTFQNHSSFSLSKNLLAPRMIIFMVSSKAKRNRKRFSTMSQPAHWGLSVSKPMTTALATMMSPIEPWNHTPSKISSHSVFSTSTGSQERPPSFELRRLSLLLTANCLTESSERSMLSGEPSGAAPESPVHFDGSPGGVREPPVTSSVGLRLLPRCSPSRSGARTSADDGVHPASLGSGVGGSPAFSIEPSLRSNSGDLTVMEAVPVMGSSWLRASDSEPMRGAS